MNKNICKSSSLQHCNLETLKTLHCFKMIFCCQTLWYKTFRKPNYLWINTVHVLKKVEKSLTSRPKSTTKNENFRWVGGDFLLWDAWKVQAEVYEKQNCKWGIWRLCSSQLSKASKSAAFSFTSIRWLLAQQGSQLPNFSCIVVRETKREEFRGVVRNLAIFKYFLNYILSLYT